MERVQWEQCCQKGKIGRNVNHDVLNISRHIALHYLALTHPHQSIVFHTHSYSWLMTIALPQRDSKANMFPSQMLMLAATTSWVLTAQLSQWHPFNASEGGTHHPWPEHKTVLKKFTANVHGEEPGAMRYTSWVYLSILRFAHQNRCWADSVHCSLGCGAYEAGSFWNIEPLTDLQKRWVPSWSSCW